MSSLHFDQQSFKQLMGNLIELPRRVGLRVFRIALNAWGGIVKSHEKRLAHRGATGLLARSPTVKVRIPDASYNVKHHGRPAYVMVGPDRRLVRPFAGGTTLSIKKATKRVLSGGRVHVRKPSRYAHFVEKNFPFIEPAQRAGASEGMAAFAGKMREGIELEAAALPK